MVMGFGVCGSVLRVRCLEFGGYTETTHTECSGHRLRQGFGSEDLGHRA